MIYPQTTKRHLSLYPPRLSFTSFTAGRVNSYALSPLELRGPNRNRFGKRFQTVYGLDSGDLLRFAYYVLSDTDRFGGEVATGSGAGRMTYGKVGYLAETGNFSRMADLRMQ